MIFRLLPVLLLMAACQTGRESYPPPRIATHSIAIHATNPRDTTFPGGRGADQLILYTPDFGPRTGTNIYGLEAIAEEGVVTHVGDNDSPVPSGGFVISGHGKAASWISDHLFPGVEVHLEGDSLQAVVTAESHLYFAEHLLSQTQARVSSLADTARINRDSLKHFQERSRSLARQARRAYQEGDPALSVQLTDSALAAARAAFHFSFPARSGEVRAVWLAMQEESPEALEETLSRVKAAGFNTICPQVVFAGYAIYPGSPNLSQNPRFAGWDPMQTLVTLSQKYQLELVPWVWVFFIGKEGSPLIKEKASWLAVSHKDVHPSEMEQGYYFFCPSRAEVRQFWLSEYRHLLTRYQVAGLQLDYIRYPVSQPWEAGYCYCDTCRSNFRELQGVDPLELDPGRDKAGWQAWTAYRVGQVNDFVRETHDLTGALQPEIRLSADIFPDTAVTRENKLQAWGEWLQNGWMDDIYTMTYTPDLGEVKRTTEELHSLLGPGQRGIVGLAPFMGLSPETLLEEIHLAREAGADGLCFFHFGSFSEAHLKALGRGPFRE